MDNPSDSPPSAAPICQPTINANQTTSGSRASDCPLDHQHAVEPWLASVLLPLDKGATGNSKIIDVCPIIGKTRQELGWLPAKAFIELLRPSRLYFNTGSYPPPLLGADGRLSPECPSFNKLKNDIQTAAHSCGSPVYSTGSSGTNGIDRVFRCAFRSRRYKGDVALEDVMEENNQDGILDSDSSGKRSLGKRNKRRTSTKQALKGENTCKFRIVITWDQFGFYLKQTAGVPYHNEHPQFVTPHISFEDLLKDDQQEACNLLDEIYSFDAVKAKELLAEKQALDASLRDRCKDYLQKYKPPPTSGGNVGDERQTLPSSTSNDNNPRKRHLQEINQTN
ncbi:unnamed protein product [Cylindrotheca closterium]|uniref:Uncharacterized protein n=1 Tax=Cylindrotheca closterium TaxID=2856 RepID=A0AAD2FIB6_9STRA|nr:unnamed protein product [Cylindrotheca closterium]